MSTNLSRQHASSNDPQIWDEPTSTPNMTGMLVDQAGKPVGDKFELVMQYDQARAAFINMNVPVMTADRTCTAVYVNLYDSDNGAHVATVDLDRTATLLPGDSISFQQGAVNLGMPEGVLAPGLHVIEEEACIEDAF